MPEREQQEQKEQEKPCPALTIKGIGVVDAAVSPDRSSIQITASSKANAPQQRRVGNE